MAAQVGALRVTVGADITGLQTGMRRAERQVAKSAGTMQRAVKGLDSSLKGLGTIGGLTLGGAGLVAGAAAFLKIADAAKSLQAQLKLATAEYGSFEKANKDVRAIAEATRSDLLATADLYSALQRNSGQLGTTQDQVARATQTVAEAFKVSGAATSEQSAATRQLIQAFQSGVLRGDEFNSVMENAPRLARLLADSLGVTVGQLRKMAEAGELTADKLVRAFTDVKFTAGIDAEFRQLPVTFDQAMSQVYNAAIVVFGAFDRGGQFSTSIANFVSDGTEGFTNLEQRAFHFGQQVGDTIAAIDAVRDALGGLKTDGIGAFFGLTDATYGWRDALAGTLGVMDALVNSISNTLNAPGNLLRVAFPGMGLKPILNPSNMKGRFLNRTNQTRVDRTRREIMGRGVNDVLAEFGLDRKPPPFRAPAGKAKKGRTSKAPRDRSDDVEFQFAQELRQAQMDVLRAQQQLVQNSEARAKLSLDLLTAERAMQEAELNERVRKAERDFAENKITAGTLQEVKVQAEKLRAEYDSKDALEREAVQAELSAKLAEESAQLREVDFDVQRGKLEAESTLAETASERRGVELRLLDLTYRQEKARLEAIIAEEQAKEVAQQNLVRLEEARRRLAGLDATTELQREGVIASTRGPMEDYLASLPTTAAKAQEALERLQVQGFEGLIDAALALTEGFDSAKDALLNTLKQFFLGMARMELQKGLGSLLQSTGGLGGLFKGAFGGGLGGGTTVGSDVLSSGIYDGIPAFASGGSMRLGGFPGVDRNVLQLNGLPIARVSHGERLNINPANDAGGWRGSSVTMNVYAPDADSFRRSEGQITRGLRRKLG